LWGHVIVADNCMDQIGLPKDEQNLDCKFALAFSTGGQVGFYAILAMHLTILCNGYMCFYFRPQHSLPKCRLLTIYVVLVVLIIL